MQRQNPWLNDVRQQAPSRSKDPLGDQIVNTALPILGGILAGPLAPVGIAIGTGVALAGSAARDAINNQADQYENYSIYDDPKLPSYGKGPTNAPPKGVDPPKFDPGPAPPAASPYSPGSYGFGPNPFGQQSAFGGGYDPYGGRYLPTERMFSQLESARMQSMGYPTAFGMR